MRQTVKDLKPAEYNPRTITKEQLQALGRALREFGDLGGIVVNTRTGNVVGGHQRIKHLNTDWKIQAQPAKDATGTTARGHIETPWGQLDYREVDWPLAKEKAANLAANKHGGAFDIDGVKALLADIRSADIDLDLTGFLGDEQLRLLGGLAGNTGANDVPPTPKTARKIGRAHV